jgi:hypothetical protein
MTLARGKFLAFHSLCAIRHGSLFGFLQKAHFSDTYGQGLKKISLNQQL